MTDETFHLTEDRLQALLDGQLPERDAGRAREHVDACARCRSRMEAWRTLFDGMESLPELSPSEGFAERVLVALPAGEPRALPWAARVRGWLGRPDLAAHPGDALLQELLDGRLRGRRVAGVERHLRACGACRRDLDGWAGVVAALERLPRLAPAAGFADGVMSRIEIPAPAPAWVHLRRLGAARIREVLSLRTRRAWAALAGVAVTPAVVTAMVAWVVFSHPLVTVGNLATFLWIEGRQLASAGGTWLRSALLESPPLFQAWSAVEGVAVAPATALAGFIVFSALTVMAVWVLYSNLFAPHAAEGRYAKLQA